MDHQQFPEVPRDLLTALEAAFPDRMPDLTETIDKVRYRQGQVSVIRFLRAHYEDQNENILSPHGVLNVSSP